MCVCVYVVNGLEWAGAGSEYINVCIPRVVASRPVISPAVRGNAFRESALIFGGAIGKSELLLSAMTRIIAHTLKHAILVIMGLVKQ